VDNEPLVSIGVPVYNDAPWLRNALDHIINQEYRNLEIIIADDGSTDGSREICREYAQRDSRIRYFENRHNLGAVENHRFVFQLSSGDFFAWGSGHDHYHLSYVRKTLKVLLANPRVVMCCTQSVFQDLDGNITRTTKAGFDTRGLAPVERFKSLQSFMIGGATANIFYALYRADVLAKIGFRKVLGCDVILLAELSLIGEMYQVDDILYYRHITHDAGQDKLQRWITIILDPHGLSFSAIMPYYYADLTYFDVIEESNLSHKEKEDLYNFVCDMMHTNEVVIQEEIMNFVNIIESELVVLEQYTLLKQYRAAQALGVIEKIKVLGFENNEVLKIQIDCLRILRDDKTYLLRNKNRTLIPVKNKRFFGKIFDIFQ
jgi:glycosyltransferase involved in cell wall biosynthesis